MVFLRGNRTMRRNNDTNRSLAGVRGAAKDTLWAHNSVCHWPRLGPNIWFELTSPGSSSSWRRVPLLFSMPMEFSHKLVYSSELLSPLPFVRSGGRPRRPLPARHAPPSHRNVNHEGRCWCWLDGNEFAERRDVNDGIPSTVARRPLFFSFSSVRTNELQHSTISLFYITLNI